MSYPMVPQTDTDRRSQSYTTRPFVSDFNFFYSLPIPTSISVFGFVEYSRK